MQFFIILLVIFDFCCVKMVNGEVRLKLQTEDLEEDTMNRMVGFLIRNNRIKKGMSQDQLCKDICAVSYLSKIEKGIAQPNPEIVAELFARLNMKYEEGEAFVKKYRELIYKYFDAYFHQEETIEFEEEIFKARKELANSELNISYQLFCLYQAGSSDEGVVKKILKDLQIFREYMREEEAFLYEMARGMFSKDPWIRKDSLIKAEHIMPNSLVSEALMYEHYYMGEYQEALNYCHSGYERAMREGFLLVAKQISFLEGVCYSNLHNLDLMLKAYNRSKELSRGQESVLASIDYNIGTAYVENERWEEAIPYLLAALNVEKTEVSVFLICHKLALAYEQGKRKEEGNIYLEKALKLSQKLEPIHQDMIRFVELRYAKDYLSSDEYATLLSDLFDMKEEMGADFVRFHKPYMVEWLKSKRKYKEAYELVAENEKN